MRILVAVTRFAPDFTGGADRRFHAMALAAHRTGHDVHVLTTNAFKKLPSGEVDGLPVRRLEWPGLADTAGWEAAAFMADTLRNESPPDVVWTSNAAMGLGIRRAWRTTPVIHAPGEMMQLGRRARLSRAWRRWRREGLGLAETRRLWRRDALMDTLARKGWAVALPSRMTLEYASSGRPDAWPALRILPRGVDVARWRPARLLRRPDPHGQLRVLVACRLVALKNVEHLLEALALCREEPVRLIIAGDGPHETVLNATADRLGVAERVEYLGMREDMESVYAGSDVLVMSSNYDLFPNTVSEALATGMPVIIRRPAPPRVMIGIYDDVAGTAGCLTYGTDDVRELAGHLASLARQPERWNAMSQGAAEWAEQRDWDRMIGEYCPPLKPWSIRHVRAGGTSAFEAAS
jgi:glycosyltransferase involved in cell wall biosynthesis